MSLLLKALKPRQVLEVYGAASAVQGRQGHFFPDYKPGPVPKTEEERIQAAKKYNLLPDEYEPHKVGEGYGDYPKRPFISVDSKDPWYPWDNPELRRDYNDPIHVKAIILCPEMMTTQKSPVPYWQHFLFFFGMCGTILGSYYYFDQYKPAYPFLERQFVTPGVKHYTFELDYDELARRKKKRCSEEEEEMERQEAEKKKQ